MPLMTIKIPFYSFISQCKSTRSNPGDGIDNDCDGTIDEEEKDGKDNDGDGEIDEDLKLVILLCLSCA